MSGLLFDNCAEMLDAEVGSFGIEIHVPVFTKVRVQVAEKNCVKSLAAWKFVGPLSAVEGEQSQQEVQPAYHDGVLVLHGCVRKLCHQLHNIHDHPVFVFVEFNAGIRFVTVPHLVEQLQYRFIHLGGVHHDERSEVFVRFLRFLYAVVGKNNTDGTFLRVVGITVVEQLHVAAVSDANDIVCGGKRFVGIRCSFDSVQHNDSFLLDSLLVI